VGTFKGIRGAFRSIQAAVDVARPGDWILIGPGDYHEVGDRVPAGAEGSDRVGAAVLVSKRLHVRGMNRNAVVVDGTRPGAPGCSARETDQQLGPNDATGQPAGRNGIVVFKADGTSVENLSACNFVEGAGGGGSAIWFDGGDGTGLQELGDWRGAYLTATSTYFKDRNSASATYGLYASNTSRSRGRGVFTQVYASNMSDAAFYVGACPDCGVMLDHARGEHSQLGYSGTNSGGHLVIQHSEFDHNQTGVLTDSRNNDDYPSPQDGACPRAAGNRLRPPTVGGIRSCWLFTHNLVHDNNDANVPGAGLETGTGLIIAGGHHDLVTGNRFFHNDAWGVLLIPFADTEVPPAAANPPCVGGNTPPAGTPPSLEGPSACYFDAFGNEITDNAFAGNGGYANPTNGDVGEISAASTPGNCWRGNRNLRGALTSDPPGIQQTHARCRARNSGVVPLLSPLGIEVACDGYLLFSCSAAPSPGPPATYPTFDTSKVRLNLPGPQPTMPYPCQGVPRNPWCPGNPGRPPAYPVPGAPAHAG
jgi:hypothetical protein